jgi:hypothetical protein
LVGGCDQASSAWLVPGLELSFGFVPCGTRHCFQNVGGQPARILVMFTPSGMERFFDRFAALPEGSDLPGAFAAIGREVGMEVVGPPLSRSHPL